MNKSIDFSIVIPVHNEEKNIYPLTQEINLVLKKNGLKTKIFFVDDGSSDRTWMNIERVHNKFFHVHGVRLRTHKGKAVALRIGFLQVKSKYVITMDGDLQDDPKEIPHFLSMLEKGNELVNGWKFHRRDPIDKTFPSKIFNKITSFLTGVKLNDINCGYKGYSSELAQSLLLHGEMHRFIPVLASAKGYSVCEIKVNHRSRKYGKSKYAWPRFFYGFFDLLTVLYLIKFQSRPLHVFGFIGMTLFGLGVAISLYLSLDKLIFLVNIGDRPLLLLGVLLIIVGLQIITFGLIGEQLTQLSERDRIYDYYRTSIKKNDSV